MTGAIAPPEPAAPPPLRPGRPLWAVGVRGEFIRVHRDFAWNFAIREIVGVRMALSRQRGGFDGVTRYVRM
ncbi:hypothetical protein GCM10023222_26660 [Saccharopolyspora cebuensis]